MSSTRVIVPAIVAIAVLWIGFFLAMKVYRPSYRADGIAERFADQGAATTLAADLPLLWETPAFSYPDQTGRVITEKDFLGKVWISDFFFTRCTSICPAMTAKMAELQTAIANTDVKFVSFSVDPDHDSPTVLKAYATMWKADDTRWHFLSTTPAKLIETAAGMKSVARPAEGDQPIQHSNIFILTDVTGKVRGVYDSGDAAALQRLTFDALRLAGTPAAQLPKIDVDWSIVKADAPNAGPGAALFVAKGCVGCHAQGRVAPVLNGRFGRTVRLSDNKTAMEDEAYTRESILDPNAKVVANYAPMMPSYRGSLTETELQSLVDYIKSLGDGGGATTDVINPASPTERLKESTDPVCKMGVPMAADALREIYNGRTYYFCSDSCHDQFIKDPAKFTTAATTQPATMP